MRDRETVSQGAASVNGATGNLSDLWMYNPTTAQWTWINGSNLVNSAGSYGTFGVAAASNSPPARNLPSSWAVGGGHLWVFGGLSAGGFLNDL